ncbi:unnamed protein product, partial [Iphiclides podalirius]
MVVGCGDGLSPAEESPPTQSAPRRQLSGNWPNLPAAERRNRRAPAPAALGPATRQRLHISPSRRAGTAADAPSAHARQPTIDSGDAQLGAFWHAVPWRMRPCRASHDRQSSR